MIVYKLINNLVVQTCDLWGLPTAKLIYLKNVIEFVYLLLYKHNNLPSVPQPPPPASQHRYPTVQVIEGKVETDNEEYLDSVTKHPVAESKRANVLDTGTELLDNSSGNTLG